MTTVTLFHSDRENPSTTWVKQKCKYLITVTIRTLQPLYLISTNTPPAYVDCASGIVHLQGLLLPHLFRRNLRRYAQLLRNHHLLPKARELELYILEDHCWSEELEGKSVKSRDQVRHLSDHPTKGNSCKTVTKYRLRQIHADICAQTQCEYGLLITVNKRTSHNNSLVNRLTIREPHFFNIDNRLDVT